MKTTSLEMSRELQDAGFWGPEKPSHYWVARQGIRSRGYYVEPQHVDCLEFIRNHNIPAATLDDLVQALGLDKPRPIRYQAMPGHEKDAPYWAWRTIYDKVTHAMDAGSGFTPDTLAHVWLEVNDNKGKTDHEAAGKE